MVHEERGHDYEEPRLACHDAEDKAGDLGSCGSDQAIGQQRSVQALCG